MANEHAEANLIVDFEYVVPTKEYPVLRRYVAARGRNEEYLTRVQDTRSFEL